MLRPADQPAHWHRSVQAQLRIRIGLVLYRGPDQGFVGYDELGAARMFEYGVAGSDLGLFRREGQVAFRSGCGGFALSKRFRDQGRGRGEGKVRL